MAGPVSERRLALFAKFRGIATERVQRLLESMPRLCASTVAQPDVIESLRELHTLKGEARMLSLVALNEVAHATEDILVVLKGRDQGLSAYERKLFSQGLDLCGDLLRLEDFGPGPYDVEVKRYLAQAKAPAPPDTSGDDHVTPVEGKTTPSAELTPPASSQKREVTVATTPPIVATEPRAISALRLETARVSVTALEDATETVGTLLLRHDEMGEYAQDIGRLHRDLSELFAGLRVRSLARRHDGEDGLAQVVERGTALLREMNVSLTRLSDGFFDHRSRILDLQDATRTMRLQPVQSLLDPLVSAARSLGRQQGKPVEVEIDSGAVVVDTKVLDVLDTALVHLLRNAIDHGLETPAVREAAGKPPAGRLRVVVKSLGALVEVSVHDDGAGVDRAQVRRVARERGLLSEESSSQWSDAQVDNLLFAAGFSTRAEVTDVSGRGVGLDAVRSAVEGVGGSISIHSVLGAGTEFRLQVPVTVALTRVLVVQATEGFFAFPTTYVEQVIASGSGLGARAGEVHRVIVDGRQLPAAPLSAALGFTDGSSGQGSPQFVVLKNAGRAFALGVQKIIGEREVVLRSLNPLLANVGVVNATAMLQGGRLLQVTHVPTLAQALATSAPAPAEVTAQPRRARPRVLVVDDSELTRDMLVDLAARIGTEPLEAVDGFDGLRVLEQQRVDLVLTDLDMPVLDGIGLIERIRQAPALRELPVVVLSTRGSDQDKERAMRAGANAYLVKAAFKPQDLRQALESFLRL